MSKRERLSGTIQGARVDRVPVALWRHFPGDDQRSADFARSVVWFQQQFDWDLLVVAPSNNYSVINYGVHDTWRGSIHGTRHIVKRPIERSLHWTDLRPHDPARGEPGKQLECLRLLGDSLDDTPLLAVVYSPLAQARRLAGISLLRRHLRTRADRLRTGLNILTESTLRYLRELERLPVAGICYITELADYTQLAEDEYQQFGLPYDEKILGALAKSWWLNMLQIMGQAPMLALFASMPVHVLSWQDSDEQPPLDRLPFTFDGALYGGLSAHDHLQHGTPTTVRAAARQAISSVPSRRFILGCSRPVPITAPLSNLQAARDVVKQQMNI